ncbi:kinase-like domain-containing protein, partial [Schizophyllum fasciatum]
EYVRRLGQGAEGTVYLVRAKARGAGLYAMKVVKKRFSPEDAERKIYRRLTRGRCNFISPLYDTFDYGDKLCVIVGYKPRGSLYGVLKQFWALPHSIYQRHCRKTFFAYAMQIVDAVSNLHADLILHRDIKPENILVDERGHIFLSDFGLAEDFSLRESPSPALLANDEIGTRGCLAALPCGTPGFSAPEIMLDSNPNAYGYETDWYSVGATLFFMF